MIFTVPANEKSELKYKLRAVNPYFSIFSNIKMKIPDRYWFDGAYRVYDPYGDEKRFLHTMNNFARVCGIESYFFTDDKSRIWQISTESESRVIADGMEIIDSESEEVGHIMPVALGSVVNACPELKEIIDIGHKK